MKHTIAFALIFCGLCSGGMCESTSAVFYSYHDGKRYDFSVTPELLANSPRWLEDQMDPPLPVRHAIASAAAYMAKLFPDAKQWTRGVVALMPVGDQWVYSIEYTEPPKNGCADCSSTPFQIIVTMDGAAVLAKVFPWKPQTKQP